MLASNQPYQRVDDGIGAGLIGGSIVGGAMAGGVHAFGEKAMTNLNERSVKARTATEKAIPDILSKHGPLSNEFLSEAEDMKAFKTLEKTMSKGKEYHAKGFGGWKGRAASYGGSILAGAALGGIGDAII